MPIDITEHYGSDDLVNKIFSALIKAGKDIDNLEIKDLSIIDQLHTGGHIATLELAKKAGISEKDNVIDAGCGIGGSSRLLVKTFQCNVTGVDLTQSFIDVARELTKSTKITDKIFFTCQNILNTTLNDNAYDVIWCQHTLMNIIDKEGVFKEFKRLLKPGGIVVLHEIVCGDTKDIYFPVPWASYPDISFLISRQQVENVITDNGFICCFIEDKTDEAESWWERVNNSILKNIDKPSPPLGPHIIFGDNGKLFGKTMSRNLHEGRIKIIEAVYVKKAD